jgi:hypothetical protein
MNNDFISRKAVLDYLKEEKDKLIAGLNKDNVIPIEARKGALLSIKAMMNFIRQLEKMSL